MTGPIEFALAATESEISACYPVMAQLRPQRSQRQFVEQVLRQSGQGYQLAFLWEGETIRAVAGFRVLEMLSRGRFLYIDDLVTDERARSRGYGRLLLDWLERTASEAGCSQVDLDSGVQRHRAHRFYFSRGYAIPSYHFSKPVS